jgi:hypothetical protein
MSDKTVTYLCKRMPQMSFFMDYGKGKKRFSFEGGVLRLTGKEASQLEELLETADHLRNLIEKVDLEAADAVAKAHAAAQRKQAVSGGMSTAHLREMEKTTMRARDVELQTQSADGADAIREELEAGGLTLTVEGSVPEPNTKPAFGA